MDNEIAESEKRKRKPKGRRRGKRLGAGGRKGRVLVSGTMLIETETLLQTQVPIFYYLFVLKVMIFNYKNRFFFYFLNKGTSDKANLENVCEQCKWDMERRGSCVLSHNSRDGAS